MNNQKTWLCISKNYILYINFIFWYILIMNTFEKIRMTLSIMLFIISVATSAFVLNKFWFSKLFSSVEYYIMIFVWMLGFLTSVVWMTKTIFAKKGDDTEVFMKFGIMWTIIFLQCALLLLHYCNKLAESWKLYWNL